MNEDVLISHLTKTFGERHLFVDQSLLLRRNHINLLLGRNGDRKDDFTEYIGFSTTIGYTS